MSFTNQTTHYGLPQWIGSDKPTYLVDQNNAYQTIDSELYNANTASGEAVTTAQGAVTTAEGAASTAATALSTAQGAETIANTADGKADNAITLAQSAQTAAGAAQTAAEAAQTAAAGNSITNLAPAYDPTQTYNVGALVTQDGKLYQCITQVSAPEAFDINKWDDKTTSEVYQEKIDDTLYAFEKTASYTIPANTYSTYLDALEWLSDHAQDVLQLESDEVAMDLMIYVHAFTTALCTSITYFTSEITQFRNIKFAYTEIQASRLFSTFLTLDGNNSVLRTAVDTSISNHISEAQTTTVALYWRVYKKI